MAPTCTIMNSYTVLYTTGHSSVEVPSPHNSCVYCVYWLRLELFTYTHQELTVQLLRLRLELHIHTHTHTGLRLEHEALVECIHDHTRNMIVEQGATIISQKLTQ